MAKKKDKCKKCKTRLVLASLGTSYGDLEAIPDDEPYVSGTTEPVYVDGQEQEAIRVGARFGCYICPECCMVDEVWVEEQ